tara:strand:- start:57 stop:563 length:507 start_codon:yes stop_codon:yes gene_type:complete
LLDNLNLVIKKNLESRKDHLLKQIIEALESNDSDLYSLLKSQWAHRFGVESLEELKNLELGDPNQKSTDQFNQEIDELHKISPEGDKSIFVNKEDNEEKEIKIKDFDSTNGDDEFFKVQSYEMDDQENEQNKISEPLKEVKSETNIEVLIPLPPQPKYSYLKKWVLRK